MISADRSKRGILFPGTPAFKRQEAYAKEFGDLDIIGFSRKADGAKPVGERSLHVHPTGSSSPLLYGWGAIRIAKGLPHPDVVTVQDPFETGLVGWWIARKLKVPLHVQVHTDFLSPEYVKLSFLNRIRVHVASFVLRRAARIRVVSGRIHDGLETMQHKAPITVLPIFVDVEKFKTAKSFERPYLRYETKVLVVARLEPEKNVLLAVRAFARSAPSDACLIIVGEGVTRKKIISDQLYQSIHDRVFFIEDEPLPDLYKSVDIVLVPSKYEGYGLVIVEALAAGKPVLSTDVGVAREAGAIVTTEKKFADALAEWFKSGPRTGELKNYPYKNFEDYVRMYCEDISACAKR